MDELVKHLEQQIAWDAFGCNVTRLKDFVNEFYANDSLRLQNIDDDFLSLVWSLVVARPTVIVGRLPDGFTSEVWIAPQTSAVRKALLAGQEHVSEPPLELAVIPDAKSRSLEDLTAEYGDSLRIGLDSDAIYATITGSHIRVSFIVHPAFVFSFVVKFPKMSPMVYSTLQLITRGRENGVSVVEIGQQSGYDQKACFYLVKQLIELDLVVKVRRGGIGSNIIIHRYFFDRSPDWKELREETTKAEGEMLKAEPDNDEEEPSESFVDVRPLGFTPIDVRHLSSVPLLRGRIIRLLKASRNQMHPTYNLLLVRGCLNPSKSDRRFFNTQLRDMVDKGILERVLVPGKKASKRGGTACIRLLNENGSAVPAAVKAALPDEDVDQTGLKINVTLHKQLVDLLENAGPTGMTLTGSWTTIELSRALGDFDRRTLELLLTRAEKYPSPAHLADLQVAGIMETAGRERRHRYFTVAGYQSLVSQENLDKASAGGHADVDVSGAGAFLAIEPALFYENEESLGTFELGFKEPRPGQRLNPDGTVKLGRPRKDGTTGPRQPRKRKADIDDDLANIPPKSRKRPRIEQAILAAEPDVPQEPKKRGRPKKVKSDDEVEAPKKKRGRTSKAKAGPEAVSKKPATRATRSRPGVSIGTSEPQDEDNVLPSVEQDTPSAAVLEPAPQIPVPMEVDIVHDPGAETFPNHANNTVSSLTETPRPPETVTTPNDAGPIQVDAEIIPASLVDPSSETAMLVDVQVNPESSKSSSSKARPAIKKPKNYSLPRVNVSQLRRENEACRVVENLGGIVNLQCKDFYEGHMALLDTLAQANEPASAPPGTRTDKRTAAATFSILHEKGRIKQLKTQVTTTTGVKRPVTIVYLPEITEQRLSSFLEEVGRSMLNGPPPQGTLVGVRKIDDELEYGPAPKPVDTSRTSLLSSKDPDELGKLFGLGDESIRETLLAERSTLLQMYGNILAKCLRARQVHLTALRAFEQDIQPSSVVSREKRIIHISMFTLDLPLTQYCQIVGPPSHREELLRYLTSETGRNTPVKDIPIDFQNMLQIRRPRGRGPASILSILGMLKMLNLAIPLQSATSDTPLVTCEVNREYPTSFDLASDDFPAFWMFTGTAPIHHWAGSETAPPFWQDASVLSSADGSLYWDLLHQACSSSTLAIDPAQESSVLTCLHLSDPALGRNLRRSTLWSTDYILTWHQTQYLKRFVDFAAKTTPLDQGDAGNALIEKLCWVTSAPPEVIRGHYVHIQAKIAKEVEKARRHADHSNKSRKAKEVEKASKASLAKRAAVARKQKERDWDDLVNKVHSDELSLVAKNRLARVRESFLASISGALDTEKWEREIILTLKEAESAAKKVLKISRKAAAPAMARPVQPVAPPPVIAAPPERSIAELIRLQGPPLRVQPSIKTTKRKRKDEEDQSPAPENVTKLPNRRTRFQWNKDYDELVRDASAIIKARCREAKRLDWGAFEQVFPSVPRNSVRQRLGTLREMPGSDAYLTRLESRFYELWIQHRGSPLLPDKDPSSASDFNLIQHIEFLRKHVDKNAIRVGYSATQEKPNIVIPNNIRQLYADFDVVETINVAPAYDFMWNTTVEEGREKKLLASAFIRNREPTIYASEKLPDPAGVAEATVKMVFGTPQEDYSADAGSRLLKTFGQDLVNSVTKNLLTRGVLSKLVRDPQKQKPGRQLKISEPNQNALGGNVNRDLFQDAAALEEISVEQEWREWPLLASDGDLAALIELVSAQKVNFKVDTTQPQAARPLLDWNSKKADDDHIETSISVQFEDLRLQPAIATVSPPPMDLDELTANHGMTVDETPACCRKVVDGVIDCSACLDEQWGLTCAEFTEETITIAQRLLWLVGQSREKGVSKQTIVDELKLSIETLNPIIGRMTDAPIPLLRWMGYSCPLSLVSASHIRNWTVSVSEEPMARIFPRRWFDISGSQITDVWEAALRAVVGAIVFRPGINQLEMRWRLRAVYDRPELNDLLRHLHEEGLIRMVYAASADISTVLSLDEKEEMEVFWLLGEKHWYQTS
ncbi:hypothetical protein C8J56DRAFT_1013301 [Mycena floridula]|nr:hypothetical protein C8J56DRAFT_1013301 [Mycena floridula]